MGQSSAAQQKGESLLDTCPARGRECALRAWLIEAHLHDLEQKGALSLDRWLWRRSGSNKLNWWCRQPGHRAYKVILRPLDLAVPQVAGELGILLLLIVTSAGEPLNRPHCPLVARGCAAVVTADHGEPSIQHCRGLRAAGGPGGRPLRQRVRCLRLGASLGAARLRLWVRRLQSRGRFRLRRGRRRWLRLPAGFGHLRARQPWRRGWGQYVSPGAGRR
mmetsp:Transcript_30521/g.87619  ORF Transcript_30521/g.87619 Transcript_30521/m.87619 type:complete len:219 (+) Transcript_30521:79-735(+)